MVFEDYMQMTEINELTPLAATEDQALARKVEFAILNVLIHYNGRYDETLLDWYSALRLGLPQLASPKQVRDVFKGLSTNGIVEFAKPNSGAYYGYGEDVDRFFSAGAFTTALTRDGLVHWNMVRTLRAPTQALQAGGRI